jgi:hypothetical protein
MSNENIFRFLAFRPAALKSKQESELKEVPLYNDNAQSSRLIEIITSAQSAGKSSEDIKKLVKGFKKPETYIGNLSDIPLSLEDFDNWCHGNLKLKVSNFSFDDTIKRLFDKTSKELVESASFKQSLKILADTILIDTLTKESDSNSNADRNVDEFVFRFKLLHLIQRTADGTPNAPENETLGEYLQKMTVKIPTRIKVKKEMPPLPKVDTPTPPNNNNALKEQLKDLRDAHRELSRIAKDSNFRLIPNAPKPPQPTEKLEANVGLNTSLLGLVANSTLKFNFESQNNTPLFFDLASSALMTPKGSAKFVLSKKTIEGLEGSTKNVLKTLKLDPAKTSPIKATAIIEKEMTFLGMQLGNTLQQKEIVTFAGGYFDKRKFIDSVSQSKVTILWDVLSRCRFEAGIGDLLIVKQKLIAYELADFAHVENVLAGESREREHRRLNLREEITVFETETEKEKERSLQSTERNEMQSEAEKTVKQQLNLDAGLQVSGSYGPTVSFTASLNAGFSTQSEESQRKATAYSREVTEKTSERLRERVREERRRRTVEEIEEINKHSINNANPANGHIRGVYRWLNKVYDAQVYNYGQRMMYEFVIPEPAAYFLYTMVDNPPKETTLIMPEPPLYGSSPLMPTNLGRDNYQEYVSLYHVANAPAPPSEFTVISFFDKQDGKEPNNFGRSSKLAIPDGYEAYAAMVSSYKTFIKGKEKGLKIMVGGVDIEKDDYWGSEYFDLNETYRGEIAISVGCFQLTSFVVSVDVFCGITDEAFTKWQHKMYDAIVQAYHIQKSEYDEKIRAAEIQKGIQILGQNPLENRRTEREELKKWVIMMLNNSPYLSMNGFDIFSDEPFLNVERSCQQGSFIRFFENAFEWNNMTYVFYPYFWGRKAKWSNALYLKDPDPDFAAFLKAGAARVQVPVRPGFEKAIAHFCQFGEIWEGNDIPLRGDNLYVPIINEITENLGKIEGGVPYPEGSKSWEVIVPTSLVVVQDLSEIPGIKDTLTDKNIDILNQEN